MRYLLLAINICIIFLLTSCSLLPFTNVNEINMIEGGGFDLTDQNNIRGTAIYPIFRPNATSAEFGIVSADAKTIKIVREKLDTKVRYRLIAGQLRLSLFSLELAKRGIYPIIDTFNRDPAIGSLIQLAIVEGETFDLLSLKEYKKENIALYIHDLLKHNSETGSMPNTDFYTFLFQYFQEGQDSFLPMIKAEKGLIKITGIALFKQDKFIAKVPLKYAFIFKTFFETYKQGLHQFKVGEKEYLAIDNIRSKKKFSVALKKGKPEFTIQLDMNARIQEYTGAKPIFFPNQIKDLSKKIEKQLERDGSELIRIFQKNNVDPLGLGSFYEAHDRNFDLKKWRKQYPTAKVKIKVHMDIIHTGIVE